MRKELQANRIGRDQEAFEIWREEYNHERPHEALGLKTPGEVYRRSERIWPETPEDIDYGMMEKRRVCALNGAIRYRGEHVGVSTALGGWSVGLKPREDELFDAMFAELTIGQLNPETCSFHPARTGGVKAAKTDNKM